MLELEEALGRILAAVPAATAERVALNQAERRVLIEDVTSSTDLPLFDNSAMDGYAVRAADVAKAAPNTPVTLRLVGRSAAGEMFPGQLGAVECVRLFTGSPLPQGADAVVMQEDTVIDSGRAESIRFQQAVEPGENVRYHGEDVRTGDPLLKRGDILTPGSVALLAACGWPEAGVARRPVVGLLATGSELREPGQTVAPGQIYESNRAALALLVRNAGSLPQPFPIVPDSFEATVSALRHAFSTCDAVVTSGGVSVGEMDFVKCAFEAAGGTLEFWRVAIKPGRPFVFGRLGQKLLFGLPGNPVSAFVTFLLLVRPALLKWQGARDLSLPAHPATAAEPLVNPGERRHFLRVRVDAAGRVFSAGEQASHIVSGLAAANALLDLQPGQTISPGTVVQALRF